MDYLTWKTLHILSMVLLFGTGLGSAFYKWMADRSGSVAHIAATNRHVVWADWLFTTPTVIFQPLSGLWMAHLAGWPWASGWIAASLALYALAGACWLPVVWLQIRMRRLAEEALRVHALIDEQALDASHIAMDFRLVHPWFGQVFRYAGRFAVQTESAP